MDAAAGEGGLERRHELLDRCHPRALRAIGLGIAHEVGIAEGHAEIREAVDRLLPADHAIGAVVQDDDDEVQPEPHRRFHLLRVHHEAAIAADRHDAALRMEHRRHHRRGQARAHRGERIVEQQRVGDMGAVVAREPDLVHAVVEADDAVLRHHLAHIVDEALRRQREAVLLGAVVDAGEDLLAQFEHPVVGRQLAFEPLGKRLDGGADVADHLGVRMVDLLDIGGLVADMDDLRPAGALHQEGRLLDRVVADGDDQVGAFDGLVDVVALRERGGAHVEVGAAGDRALAHLGVEERQPRAPHEARKRLDQRGPVARRADHHERALCREDHLGRAVERGGTGRRAARAGGPE